MSSIQRKPADPKKDFSEEHLQLVIVLAGFFYSNSIMTLRRSDEIVSDFSHAEYKIIVHVRPMPTHPRLAGIRIS